MVKEGDTIAVGQDIVKIDLDGKAGASAPAAAPAPKPPGASSVAPKPVPPPSAAPKPAAPKPAAAPKPQTQAPVAPAPKAPASPSVAPVTFAEGVVPGLAPLPASLRTERRQKMNRMRQRISERLKESQNTAASLTTFNEVDMSSLIEFRKKYQEEVMKTYGVKMGFMGAFAKASVLALQAIPAVNASIEGTEDEAEMVFRDYVDLSIAVATPKVSCLAFRFQVWSCFSLPFFLSRAHTHTFRDW